MAGETDLHALLRGMAPVLHMPDYVFCTLPAGSSLPGDIAVFATVREDEGLTVVVERDVAATHGWAHAETYRAITLSVHSSLEAVGFIAAVAQRLAERGIPANVIAGYHHDHGLVPAARAADAVRALHQLARED